jgi:hypothetical protein
MWHDEDEAPREVSKLEQAVVTVLMVVLAAAAILYIAAVYGWGALR